jgi:hypothetical protein
MKRHETACQTPRNQRVIHHYTIHHIQQSKDTIHLYKVEAHADILGNECADAIIAKCSAEKHSGHDIHINTTPTPIHPYFGQQG